MRLILVFFNLVFIASCIEKPPLHLADLKKSSALSSEVILFKDSGDFESSEPSHNMVPPYGRIETERIILFQEGNCLETGVYRFCGDNDRLTSRLKMIAISGNSQVHAKPIGGSIS